MAALAHTGDQLLFERFEPPLASPGGHRPPQLIGLAGSEAAGDHRQLHHLFLENRHAAGAPEDGGNFRTHRLDGFLAVPATQVGMDHVALDRPRPDQRHFDDQVVEIARSEARQHGHLCTRFDLKDADRVGSAKHVIDCRVFGRYIRQVNADQIQRPVDRREHAEGQDVDFQQSERVEIVLVPLDHRTLGHGGIL